MAQQINLYNPQLEIRREWLSLSYVAACWLLVAVVIGSWAAWVIQASSAVAAQEAAEKAQIAALQAEVMAKAAQAAALKRDAAADLETTRLQNDVHGREEIFTRLNSGAIGNTTGFSGYLRAFARQSMDGMWLTGLHIQGAGRDITLEGRALRPELVPNYLRRLNRESKLEGHAFATLAMERPAAIAMVVDKDKEARMELPAFVEFRMLSQPPDAAKGPKQ